MDRKYYGSAPWHVALRNYRGPLNDLNYCSTGNTMSTSAITFIDTSPESCDRLRQVIYDEIDSLEESSTRVLKSHQNEPASISRLPPKTLAAIFSFLSLSAWRGETGKLVYCNETGRYAWHNETGSMAWICVSHVCEFLISDSSCRCKNEHRQNSIQ